MNRAYVAIAIGVAYLLGLIVLVIVPSTMRQNCLLMAQDLGQTLGCNVAATDRGTLP